MAREVSKRFQLSDAMALIAATAIGLAIIRAAHPGLERQHGPCLYLWLDCSVPLVVLWMIAILGIQLIPPRPGLRRLARQPGLVACFITAVYTSWRWINASVVFGARAPKIVMDFWSYLVFNLGSFVAGVLTVAWLTLAFSGRWRPKPTWTDRTARILAIYLIVIFWLAPILPGWSHFVFQRFP